MEVLDVIAVVTRKTPQAGVVRTGGRAFHLLQTLQPAEVPDTAPFSTQTTQERLLPVRACGYGQLNVYIIDS